MLYPLLQTPIYAKHHATLSCASSLGLDFGGGVNLQIISYGYDQTAYEDLL
jgi:hypothetical protein